MNKKKILCIAIIFFDFEVIKKSVDFLVQYSDQYDLIVVENYSEFTESLIKPYIKELLKDNKINQYILFDKNITNNAIEVILDSSQLINWDNYDYILLTDGDLEVSDSNWLQKQLNILNNYPDIFACAVGLDTFNLPIKTFPDADKWIPKPIQEYDNYTETLTGLHLVLINQKDLLKFIDWRQKSGLKFVDSVLHQFCYHVLYKKWAIPKEVSARHLTWDTYQNLDHPYTRLKLAKTFNQTWNHGRYSDYTIYTKYQITKINYKKSIFNLMRVQQKKAIEVIRKMKSKMARIFHKINCLISASIDRVDLYYRKKIFYSKLYSFKQPYKLHLGCGNIKFKDWINIDGDSSVEAVDIVWDLSKQIPLEDCSCQLLYCEHFLEHLTIEQGLSFLQECYRLLQENGILRVAVPSLEYIVEKYSSSQWKEQDWLTWKEHEFIKTRAEMINIAFRWWGHQWLYDREELHRRLREAGFKQIRDVEWGCSEIPELNNLETRKDSILICEALK